MKTQPWTQDKLAAKQRHDRLALRWSGTAESSTDAMAAGERKTRLQRVNRIAVMVTPGVVAMAAALIA